jgi:hypothetical protein
MRALAWLLELWHRIEPAERLDWILETLGLRERVHQIIVAVLSGIVMLVFQRLKDAPLDWTILMVLGSAGLTIYFLNQLSQWSNIRHTYNTLRALNPNARPTIRFFTGRRISTYIISTCVIIFTLSLHRGPSGIEWPWFAEKAEPSSPPPSSPSVSAPPPSKSESALGNDFYVSFSFPRPAIRTESGFEMELRFLNHEENPVTIENISVMELFGYDKEPYRQLDDCYDPTILQMKQSEVSVNSSPNSNRSQGSFTTKTLNFVSYATPIDIRLNGKEASFPLTIPSKQPIIVNASFAVDPVEKNIPTFNFLAVCPSIKLFDTRGQESVSVCPGTIEMTFAKEEYIADSARVARLIAKYEKHLWTSGPPPGSDMYRVLAQRTGWFQLTPQTGANSCPLVAR